MPLTRASCAFWRSMKKANLPDAHGYAHAGNTLQQRDGITPGVATDPASGNYCLIMPCRFTEEAEVDAGVETAQAPVPAIAA